MKTMTIACILVLSLSACRKDKIDIPPEVVIIEGQKRTPPADAMQACPNLGELDDKSFGAVVRKLGDASELYKQCEQKRKELADFINAELPNVKK